MSLIERWKLMIGPDDENDVWAVAPEDDRLDAPDGYRVIEVVPASHLEGAVEVLRLACTVDGRLGYRTANGVRQDMPKAVEVAVRNILGGQ